MEDAKGIPERGEKGTIPKDRLNKWKLNVQEHKADKAGKHYDIRLNPPNSEKAYSWAARHFPGPGEKTTAVQTDVHAKDYLGFSGEISEGYGKGKVDSLTLEDVEVLKSDDDHVKFNRYKGRDTERYIMMRKPGTDEFLFYNYTPTEKSKIYQDVPKYKEKYKNVPLDKLDPKVRNDKEIWSPKLDGAHNLVVLRGDKSPDVFSYRKSRREGDKFIDHTFRTPIYKNKVPKEFKKTILRGELYIPGQPGQEAARLLNSNVWKSRDTQQKEGKPLELGVFDVVKWKGKDVENLPFEQKIPMLQEVENKIQGIKHTPWYQTEKEKQSLRRQILNEENPLTQEGIAIYDLDSSTPRKSKKEDDWDGEIVGVFKATPGSKYHGNAVGGFLVKPEGSDNILRVGSGLDDETRRDAYENPDKYKGEWGKFKSQRVHASGKHQAPIFKEMRTDKFYRPNEKTANLIINLAKEMKNTEEKESWEDKHLRSAGRIAPKIKSVIAEHGGIRLEKGTLSDKAIKKYFDDKVYGTTVTKGGHQEIYERENPKMKKKANMQINEVDRIINNETRKQVNKVRKGYAKDVATSGLGMAAFSGAIDVLGGATKLLPKPTLKRSLGTAGLFGGISSAFTAATKAPDYSKKVKSIREEGETAKRNIRYLQEMRRRQQALNNRFEKTSEVKEVEGFAIAGGLSGLALAALKEKSAIAGLAGGSLAGAGLGGAVKVIKDNRKKNK